MGLNKELLELLKKESFFIELFLVPGSPPQERSGNSLTPVLNKVLQPEDTKNFLIYLRELAGKVGPLQKREVFTVSLPQLGRVRVIYGLQRGSYYLTLLKVPFEVPPPENLFANPAKFDKFYKSIYNFKGKTFVVIGNDWFINATFIFCLFERILENGGRVILTVENPLAYLLKHRNGLALQKELYVDNPSFDDTLKDLPLLAPDFLYIFDVLNIYTLPLKEVFYHLPPFTNLFLNFPVRSEGLLKSFLREKIKLGETFIGIKIQNTLSGLLDFSLFSVK